MKLLWVMQVWCELMLAIVFVCRLLMLSLYRIHSQDHRFTFRWTLWYSRIEIYGGGSYKRHKVLLRANDLSIVMAINLLVLAVFITMRIWLS